MALPRRQGVAPTAPWIWGFSLRIPAAYGWRPGSPLRCLDAEAWQRRGTANRNEITVRALAYCLAGHELHHMAILKEKYHLGV